MPSKLPPTQHKPKLPPRRTLTPVQKHKILVEALKAKLAAGKSLSGQRNRTLRYWFDELKKLGYLPKSMTWEVYVRKYADPNYTTTFSSSAMKQTAIDLLCKQYSALSLEELHKLREAELAAQTKSPELKALIDQLQVERNGLNAILAELASFGADHRIGTAKIQHLSVEKTVAGQKIADLRKEIEELQLDSARRRTALNMAISQKEK